MAVTKADLEQAKKVAEVDLSEWIDGEDSKGYVCALSAANGLAIAKAAEEAAEDTELSHAVTVRWAILSFCDDKGKLVFEDDDSAAQFFGDRPWTMIEAICEAAMKVNGAGEDGQQETAKN